MSAHRAPPALILTVALAFSAGACSDDAADPMSSASPSTSSPTRSAFPTAEATALAYYRYLGQHDVASAAALLAPALRRDERTLTDGDLTNVTSVTHVQVDATGGAEIAPPGGLAANYDQVTQVTVTYDAEVERVITYASGPQTRFLYVGRERAASHRWRILSIGTGP